MALYRANLAATFRFKNIPSSGCSVFRLSRLTVSGSGRLVNRRQYVGEIAGFDVFWFSFHYRYSLPATGPVCRVAFWWMFPLCVWRFVRCCLWLFFRLDIGEVCRLICWERYAFFQLEFVPWWFVFAYVLLMLLIWFLQSLCEPKCQLVTCDVVFLSCVSQSLVTEHKCDQRSLVRVSYIRVVHIFSFIQT